MAIAPILCQRGAILIMTTSIMVGTIGDGVVHIVHGHLATAGAHGAGATILHIIMDIMTMVIRIIHGAITIIIGMADHITIITIIIIMIMVGVEAITIEDMRAVARRVLVMEATHRRARQME